MSDTTDRDSTVAEVSKVIHSSLEWPFPEKDPDRLLATIAKDSSFFIFHPDSKSTIEGYEAFRRLTMDFFMKPEMKPLGTEIMDLRIHLSRGGDCAWWTALLNDWGEYEGRAYNWKNSRWTGVLEKREGTWVIVQMHFSLPSDAKSEDDEAAGKGKG